MLEIGTVALAIGAPVVSIIEEIRNQRKKGKTPIKTAFTYLGRGIYAVICAFTRGLSAIVHRLF